VTKRITSDALFLLNRMLGLAGGTPGPTELDDGNVTQVLDIIDVVRRSRTIAASQGWFFCIMDNVHAAAGALDSEIDPYTPGAAFAPNVSAYPARVGRDFDFWLYTASLVRIAGDGALDGALLRMNPTAAQMGWGIDNSGAAVAGDDPYPIGRFTALDSTLAARDPYGIAGDGKAYISINQRIARGNLLRFTTDTSGQTVSTTFRLFLTCGLFSEGIGQDIAS